MGEVRAMNGVRKVTEDSRHSGSSLECRSMFFFPIAFESPLCRRKSVEADRRRFVGDAMARLG